MDKRLFKARIEELSKQQTAANFEVHLNTIKNPAKSFILSRVSFFNFYKWFVGSRL